MSEDVADRLRSYLNDVKELRKKYGFRERGNVSARLCDKDLSEFIEEYPSNTDFMLVNLKEDSRVVAVFGDLVVQN